MHLIDLNFFTAFLAGIASFIAPCTFSTVPVFLSYISGVTYEEATIPQNRKKVVIASLFYSFGFIIFFSLIGLGLNFLGGFLINNKDLFKVIGGLLIIVFGIYMLFQDQLNIQFLMGEKKVHLGRLGDGSLVYVGAFIIGFVNAFAWSPCIGPIYGQILSLSLSQANAFSGFYYSIIYALGLMVPFIGLAIFFGSSRKIVAKLSKYSKKIYTLMAIIFIILGIMILTNTFNTILVANVTKIFNFFGFDETRLPI